MKIEIVTMTPDRAAALLENNPSNRPLRRFQVEAYARDMARGLWQTNGDAVRLNGDGSLIDGQHRLAACVKSGIPFETILISGLPSDVRATIDGGAKRTHGDRLSMTGTTNANNVSAALRLIARVADNTAISRYSSRELDLIFRANPGIESSVSYSSHAFPRVGSTLSAVHYIGCATGHGEAADAFVGVFKSGIPTYPGDAAHALRERLVKFRGTPTDYTPADILPVMVAVWRHFIAKTPVRVIKIPNDITISGWTHARLGLVQE